MEGDTSKITAVITSLSVSWCTEFFLRVPPRAGNFPLHHHLQTGSGAHPASYPMVARGALQG